MTRKDKTPVNDIEMENALLSLIIFNPELIETAKFNRVTTSTFYNTNNSVIYGAIQSLHLDGIPVDSITVTEKLSSLNSLEKIGGPAALSEFISTDIGLPTPERVDYYCRRLKSLEGLRLLGRGLIDSYEKTFDSSSDIEIITEDINKYILQVTDEVSNSDIQKFEIDEALKPIPPGLKLSRFRYLMGLIGSFRKNELIIIAARPSVGKTAFALDIQLDLASQGIPTGIISLEQNIKELQKRILSKISKVDLLRLLESKFTLQDQNKLDKIKSELNFKENIYLDDSCTFLSDIVYKSRKLRYLGCELIIVDYTQLIELEREKSTRDLDIGVITRTMKRLSKSLDVPYIALSQVNRKVEDRKDPTPRLGDLRESGNLEQDADVVIFISRPDIINNQAPSELVVGKCRNGKVGSVPTYFESEYITFYENDKGEYEKTKHNNSRGN